MHKKKRNLLISERGQITLPLDLRKRFGLYEGGVIILEERRGEFVLKPAAVMEVNFFSDADAEAWRRQDRNLTE